MEKAPESDYYAPLSIAFPVPPIPAFIVRNNIIKSTENLYYKRVCDSQSIDFLVIRALTPQASSCNGRRAERF